jgi:uncharacterized repeat protein (TIGR03847 family)
VARRIVDVDAPDRFAAGEDESVPADASTDGLDDGFYLEVVRRRRRMSVTLAREQMVQLAGGILSIIEELERRGLVAIDIAPLEPEPPKRPRRHAFRAETLLLEWDEDGHRVVVEARSAEPDGVGDSAPPPGDRGDDEPEALDEVPDDAPLGPDVLRVRLAPYMAQRFARQAARLAGDATPVVGRRRGPGRDPSGA